MTQIFKKILLVHCHQPQLRPLTAHHSVNYPLSVTADILTQYTMLQYDLEETQKIYLEVS